MANGDILEARIVARFCGEPVINTFGFSVVASSGPTWHEEAAGLRSDIMSALGLDDPGGLWITGLNVQYVLQSLQIVDVMPGESALEAATLGSAGTVADDDAMPPNDALCVTWRSSFKGQGARGRTYMTGFSEGAANGGFWEGGTQDHCSAVAGQMLATFGEAGSSGYRFCVIHKTSNGGVPGAPVVKLDPPEIKPIMDYTVHNEVRSIGRRAVGRRIHRRRTAP